MVVEVFVDDDVDHGHGERGVGADAQAQRDVGAAREPVHARIDGDKARASAHKVDERVAKQAVAVGGQRHLAPHDEALGKHEFRVVVAPGKRRREVDFRVSRADDVAGSGQARDVAGVARLRVTVVWRAEHHRAVGVERAALAAGAHEDDAALPAVFFGDTVVVFLDDGDGLVPRDALPCVGIAAFFRVALHRVDDARRIVHVITQGEAAHAEPSLRDWAVLIALHVDDLAIGVRVNLQAAARRVTARRRPGRQAGYGESVFFVTPRLAEVVYVGQCV